MLLSHFLFHTHVLKAAIIKPRVSSVIVIARSSVAALKYFCMIFKCPRRRLCPRSNKLPTTTLLMRNVLERFKLVCRKAIPGNPPALSILVGNSLGDYIHLSMARLCASPHSVLDHHLPSTCRLLTAHTPLCLALFLPLSMSQPSSLSSASSTFRILFDAALQDYRDKTGSTLTDHPIAKQLETCESVNSITAILQEQARSFREFTENDGKLMKALNSSVDVLCSPSISSAMNEAIGLVVRRKASISVHCS